MSEFITKSTTIQWDLNSPWAMESYASAIELEQAQQRIIQGVLSRIIQRLNISINAQPPSAARVRALFTRYQNTASAPKKLLSEMLVEMREE